MLTKIFKVYSSRRDLKRANGRMTATNVMLLAQLNATTARLERAEAALRKIEALETPKCAHVGRVMARIAREGLGEDQARELAA